MLRQSLTQDWRFRHGDRTTPEIATGSARVNVRTTVDNTPPRSQQVTLRSRVIGPDGAQVGLAETHAEIAAGS